MGLKTVPSAIASAIGLVIWFAVPVPEGVTADAWHLLAIFVATIAAIIGEAMPIGALAMLAIAASKVMMTLTRYATGSSQVIFGSGYTTLAEWWRAGFVMSLTLIAVWLLVGGVWWTLLGYW